MKKSARKYHRRVWSVLGILLPAIVVGALAVRQTPPTDRVPVLIEAPKEN